MPPRCTRFVRRIDTEKRPSVYAYRVHSPVSANRKLLLAGTGTNCRLFVEVDRISVGTRLYTKCARIERFQCIGVSF